MRTQATRATDLSVPNDLESARAKLVYLYVTVNGGATVEEICRDLAIGTGTALTITKSLRRKEHVQRRGDRYVPT